MIVHEVAARIPFHTTRIASTPLQDPSADAITRYSVVAAAVLNHHSFTGSVWTGLLQHREEIWHNCSERQEDE